MKKVIMLLFLFAGIAAGCTMLDHSWQGWLGGGYSIGEGKDDPGMPPPVDLKVPEDAIPSVEKTSEPVSHSVETEIPLLGDPIGPVSDISDDEANQDEIYLCAQEKGFLECAKPPPDPLLGDHPN